MQRETNWQLSNLERGIEGSVFASQAATLTTGQTGVQIRLTVPKSTGFYHKIFATLNYRGGGTCNFRSVVKMESNGRTLTSFPFEYGIGSGDTRPFVTSFPSSTGIQTGNGMTILFDEVSDLQLNLQPVEIQGLFDTLLVEIDTNAQSVNGLDLFVAVLSS